jgi:hypothetical protein
MSDDWARPVVHWEIEALDAERQRAFYAELFNWEIGDGPIMPVPAGLGGPEPGPAGHVRQGDRSGVALYIQVRDIHASLVKAADLGGHRDLGTLRHPRRSDAGPDHRPRGKPGDVGAAVARRRATTQSSVSYRLVEMLEGASRAAQRVTVGSPCDAVCDASAWSGDPHNVTTSHSPAALRAVVRRTRPGWR